jgi:hypothetical protein
MRLGESFLPGVGALAESVPLGLGPNRCCRSQRFDAQEEKNQRLVLADPVLRQDKLKTRGYMN